MKSSKSVTNSEGANPFDAVKIELAVIIGLAVGVLLVIWRLDLGHVLELILLAGLGLAAGGWLAVRTRQITPQDD
ncbi:MAG: hypothetical protein KGY57_05650 [Gammaproteobacteria bacterium]|nr:hypothetical protein [Gammaproteobacteria bacterium]